MFACKMCNSDVITTAQLHLKNQNLDSAHVQISWPERTSDNVPGRK